MLKAMERFWAGVANIGNLLVFLFAIALVGLFLYAVLSSL